MDEGKTTYPEYRHAAVARYGRFRIDRTWIRTNLTDAQKFMYELVFEIDDSTEFDLMASLITGRVYARIAAGEVLSASEVHRVVSMWLDRMRPTPGGGVVALACYRRRIGPLDAAHEPRPGEWYVGHHFRRPGKPMIDMPEAVPLIEAALRGLVESKTNT